MALASAVNDNALTTSSVPSGEMDPIVSDTLTNEPFTSLYSLAPNLRLVVSLVANVAFSAYVTPARPAKAK